MKRLLLLALALIAPFLSEAQVVATGNNMMMDFRYTSCTKSECIEVSAPKAWISLASGGFTTEGKTQIRVLETFGKLRASHIGTTATLNSNLAVVVLEKDDSAVELFSLRETPGESK